MGIEMVQMNEAAIGLVGKAKNKLQSFYNPSLAKKAAASASASFIQASEAKRRDALQLMDEARECQQENKPNDAQSKMMQARRALEESLELCNSNHKARILLVSYTINSEEYEFAMKEALIIYNDLSKEQLRNMKDPVLHLSIAHAAKMLSEMDQAIHYAKEATELYSEDPQPYMILGE